MTVKEVLEIAGDDQLVRMIKYLNRSMRNDESRDRYNLAEAKKERRNIAREIKASVEIGVRKNASN